MRLDLCLCERSLAKSRTLAARLITSGAVSVNRKTVTKPSFSVTESDEITVAEHELCRYVSRGGLKLEEALRVFDLSPQDCVAFDFGASTGGFTDCLLQHGAARVFAVDVGKSQLDEQIRADFRVVCLEETDARTLTLPERCDLGVMDVSFISQAKLYEAAARQLKEGGHLVTLFKPQFEVGRAHVSKGGIVRDVSARDAARFGLLQAAKAANLKFVNSTPSPILGGDGNYEELLLFLRCEDV